MKPMENNTQKEHFFTKDNASVQQDADRLSTTLDAKCKRSNLQEITSKISNLNQIQKKQLKGLLTDNESLFDGTLG